MRLFPTLLRQAGAGLRMLIVLTVILGILYPLSVWVVSRIPGLHGNAEGSVVYSAQGVPVGSDRIGIDPVARKGALDPYFHTRPSASADGALGPGDPSTSGPSNLAGGSDKLLKLVSERKAAIAAREGVAPAQVPPDAVTASGSGVDPDISPAYAAIQVRRVATATGLSVDRVRAIVAAHTRGRELGVLGDPTVNVLECNLAVQAAVRGAH